MSIFRRAFGELFSPRRNADIINDSTKVVDDDNNSFSDGDQIEKFSDDEGGGHNSPSNGSSTTKNVNNGGDYRGKGRKRRKQVAPRKSVIDSSDEEPGNLVIDTSIDSEPSQKVRKSVKQEDVSVRKMPCREAKTKSVPIISDDLANECKKATWSSCVLKGKPPIKTPYVIEEDEALLCYLAKSRRLAEIKGNLFWQEAEELKATKSYRSWQSMKERFRKHIMPNISLYRCITQKEKEVIDGYYRGVMSDSYRAHVCADRERRAKVVKNNPKPSNGRKSTCEALSDLDISQEGSETESSTNKERRTRLPRKKSAGKPMKPVLEEATEEDCGEEDHDPEEQVDEAGTIEDRYLNYVSKVQKSNPKETRSRAFIRDEDLQLMSIIFNRSKKEVLCLGGNTFWKGIENEFDRRTWASLKERFSKRIIPQLSTYCNEDDMSMRIVNRLVNLDGAVKNKKTKEDIVAACEKVFEMKSME